MLSQSWGAVASLSLLHRPSRAAPGGVAMSPRGKSPAHRLTSAPGGWQWEGQPQSPQGTRHRARTLSVKPGCTARPPPSTHLTCRMSPAVSLATAMASRTPRAAFPCIPCDVGPVSRVTQHPGALAGRYRGSPAASCCAREPRATWQHCCGGPGGLGWGAQARCWQVWGSRQPCLSRQSSAHALLTAGARGSAGCGEPWAAQGWEEKQGLGTLCLHKGPGTGSGLVGSRHSQGDSSQGVLASVQDNWSCLDCPGHLGVTGLGRRALVRWVQHPSPGWSWGVCLQLMMPFMPRARPGVSALGRKCPLCSVNSFAPSHSTWHVSVPCSQCKACPPLPVHVSGGPGTPKLCSIRVQCWLPGQGRLGASHDGQFQALSPAVDPEPGNSLSEAAVSALPGECAWMKSEPAAGAGQDFPVDPVLCPVCWAGS